MKSFSWRICKLVVLLQLYISLFLIQDAFGSAWDNNSTCRSTEFQCADGHCIAVGWTCDQDDDCGDNSDELPENCPVLTCSELEYRCKSGKCIPLKWKCDNDTDCPDGSDEGPEHCGALQTCESDKFVCNSSACIPLSWQCDGQEDCSHGEDELGCEAVEACKEGEFQCANNHCIAQQWYCDGDNDCKDNSDELDCGKTVCTDPQEFKCNDGPCIKQSWVCDGDADCSDGSDEHINCTVAEDRCGHNQFMCKRSRECIHLSWFCDSDKDCEDESDEDCVITCRSDQFMCKEGSYCLSDSVRCNGMIDCRDGSDEEGCVVPKTCPDDQFDCTGEGTHCIPRSHVCDGRNDCGNNQDESDELTCQYNPCNDNNGGCEQVCINQFQNKHKCGCYAGFKLMENSSNVCDDVDECLDNYKTGVCSQTCYNTKGGYKCGCTLQYSLINGRYCKATGGHPELLLADRKDLRRIHLQHFDYSLLVDNDHVSDAIAMDFDYQEMKFYWTDVELKKIFRADFKNTSSMEAVVSTNVDTTDGLALDWIHKHLYWTDTGLDTIEVSNLDGTMRKTLINTGLDEPRAIVLDPSNGYMYWTDWGTNPKIERCGMNGANREVIVDTQITWPNGLTIDYPANRLYWIDAKQHTIESSNLQGQERIVVLRSHFHLNHPFAITVFEDFLYWTDWPSESVRKYSKFSKGDVDTIALDLHSPMDVRVFHPYRQPNGTNACGVNNGGCAHFCLPSPFKSDRVPHFTCECQNGFTKVGPKGEGCIESKNTPSTTSSSPVKSTEAGHTKSPNSSRNNHTTSHVSVVTVPTSAVPNATVPVEISSEPVTVSQANITEAFPHYKPEDSIGHIAGIVVAILAVVIIVAAVACFILYKKYSRNHGKSMNFDNPVYRKTTTDEQFIIEKNVQSNVHPSMQPLTQPCTDVV